jgi:hypothetical protein
MLGISVFANPMSMAEAASQNSITSSQLTNSGDIVLSKTSTGVFSIGPRGMDKMG